MGRDAASAAPMQLIVEPAEGITPIYELLSSARHSLDLVMYELQDPRVDAILAADARRGVDVRVLLDSGYERRANTPAFDYLAAHQVSVHWSSSRFEITHEKSFVVDGRTAVVMTLNFTQRYYATTRDFAVVDSEPADVSAIAATFGIDWSSSRSTAPTGVDLLWSPGSSAALVALLTGARHLVQVESEEMDDRAIIDALVADARRGVRVEVTMTADTEWDTAFATLRAAGVAVHVEPDTASALYIHAKAVVVDAGTAHARAFVGSENFSAASLDYNRELGLVTSDLPVVNGVAGVLAADFASAPPWR
jgi:phosphatidylserine/phosphatidylglycerophosphate/cardiolipin synthase-like enzyme